MVNPKPVRCSPKSPSLLEMLNPCPEGSTVPSNCLPSTFPEVPAPVLGSDDPPVLESPVPVGSCPLLPFVDCFT